MNPRPPGGLVRHPRRVMVRATTSRLVRAPRATVYGIFTDVRGWPQVFPTISWVRVLREEPDEVEVVVGHREGEVRNRLMPQPPGRALLLEGKRHYDAVFANDFVEEPGGRTTVTVHALIELKGWRRVLSPFLGGYVRRQVDRFTLSPVAEAAESRPEPEQPSGVSR